jgi:hypothetical protein
MHDDLLDDFLFIKDAYGRRSFPQCRTEANGSSPFFI